jgi:hypothetical protein
LGRERSKRFFKSSVLLRFLLPTSYAITLSQVVQKSQSVIHAVCGKRGDIRQAPLEERNVRNSHDNKTKKRNYLKGILIASSKTEVLRIQKRWKCEGSR